MNENPFFEFVGASSYNRADQCRRVEGEFEVFSKKHGKQYKNIQEIAERKSVFNHNYRYVYMHCMYMYVLVWKKVMC